jgi:hypothetical protein
MDAEEREEGAPASWPAYGVPNPGVVGVSGTLSPKTEMEFTEENKGNKERKTCGRETAN